MAIRVSAYASIERVRGASLTDRFARTHLANGPVPAIAHSYIDAEVTRIDRSADCHWRIREIHVRVLLRIEFDSAQIARGYFDPDEANPHGYTDDTPRDPSHWQLDEENVAVHEESHAQDIVAAIEAEVRRVFDQAETQGQLEIIWNCDDEQGAYDTLHRMVRERIRTVGTAGFAALLADFQQHKSNSATERKARQAQIAEHASR